MTLTLQQQFAAACAQRRAVQIRTGRLVWLDGRPPLTMEQLAATVPVPATITPAQLRLQLAADGKSAADVEAVIAHLPEPMKTQATILFEYSLEFERAHPLVQQLAAALGYDTAAKLDAFFTEAAKR